jgi:pantetheine-phosphate adenylyltransferase
MLDFVDREIGKETPGEIMTIIYLAIIFHDVVYDTKSSTNEEDSWMYLKGMLDRHPRDWSAYETELSQLILSTKKHEYRDDLPDLVKLIIRADLERLSSDFPEFWENTIALMKEYSFVDFADFKRGRLEFFKTYGKKISTFLPARAVWNLEQAYATLSVWKPRIAVYPGSFNPFHRGHLRILQKAERMFDKVIVARGFNPDKAGAKIFDLPKEIQDNYQVDTYFGLLTDYLKTKEYPVTVIRGLRSGMDLHAEITQYRYLQDLMPEIDLVNIFTDTDVEHISSSGIKSLHPYMDKTPYEL